MTHKSESKLAFVNDMKQILLIAEHELRKSIKGWRFPLIFIIVIMIPLLIYALPLAAGERYTTDDCHELYYTVPYENAYYPEYHSYCSIWNPGIVPESLRIFVNSSEIPNTEWFLSGRVLILTLPPSTLLDANFDCAISSQELHERLMFHLPYLIVSIAIITGADMLVGEIQNRTGYLLLPNPVRRAVIVCGKMMSSIVIGLVTIVATYIFIYLLVFMTLGTSNDFIMISFGYAILYFLSCMSISYALSAVLRTSTSATALPFLIFFIVSPVFQMASIRYGLKPWFLPSFAGDCISTSLRLDDYPQDVIYLGGSVPSYNFYPDPIVSVMILMAYAIGFAVISIFIFGRRDMTG